jgi:hypothetical protein
VGAVPRTHRCRGSSTVSAAEKAMVKKIAVSSVEEIRVETSGAFHQLPAAGG